MKHMNMKKKYQSLELQLFADDGGDSDTDRADSGDGDDQDDEESGEDGENEKKFSQKELEDAVKKRLARERRKWQREQQKKESTADKDSAGTGESNAGVDAEKASVAEKQMTKLEVKVACYEADVAKDAVDDVAALAHAYMEADDTLDLEDAIEKVVKKYPHFKKGGADPYESNPDKGKSWGERQSGSRKKQSGVEAAFMKKNPGLKID